MRSRNLPDDWLRRPECSLTPEEIESFRAAWRGMADSVSEIVLPPGSRAWQFLDWLHKETGVLFHGSPNGTVTEFLPRTPNDRSADDFSKQTVWSIFYAVWANPGPVKPIARVPVGPADFPLLAQVRTHEDEQIIRDQARDPLGFPWLP